MQKYKKFFYRQKFFVLLENLQRLFHICFKKKGAFLFSFAAAIFVKHAYFAVAPAQIRRACDQNRPSCT